MKKNEKENKWETVLLTFRTHSPDKSSSEWIIVIPTHTEAQQCFCLALESEVGESAKRRSTILAHTMPYSCAVCVSAAWCACDIPFWRQVCNVRINIMDKFLCAWLHRHYSSRCCCCCWFFSHSFLFFSSFFPVRCFDFRSRPYKWIELGRILAFGRVFFFPTFTLMYAPRITVGIMYALAYVRSRHWFVGCMCVWERVCVCDCFVQMMKHVNLEQTHFGSLLFLYAMFNGNAETHEPNWIVALEENFSQRLE